MSAAELVTDELIEKAAKLAASWGVRSGHGDWTDEETQRHCAEDILKAVAGDIAANTLREAQRSMDDLLDCSGDTRWKARMFELTTQMGSGGE